MKFVIGLDDGLVRFSSDPLSRGMVTHFWVSKVGHLPLR